MNRRAFTATLASVLGLKLPAASDAVTVMPIPAVATSFDPVAYAGEFKWVNQTVEAAWTERYRNAYKELAEKYEPAP